MELNKLLPIFIQPIFVVLVLVIVGSLLKNRLRGKLLVAFGCLIIVTLGCPPVADRLIDSLQNYYPTVSVAASPNADAVVLLGGVVGDPRKGLSMEWNEAADRFEQSVNLMKANKAKRLILTSGPDDEEGDGRYLYPAAQEHGIPKDSILFTSRSYNTAAEASNIKELAQKQGIRSILLVTSAFHMRRSMILFQRTGLTVYAFPVDYVCCNNSKPYKVHEYFPSSGALSRSETTIREYCGLLFYWLKNLAT